MHKAETQQFARFFLKDLKTKNSNYNKEKSHIDCTKLSSSN